MMNRIMGTDGAEAVPQESKPKPEAPPMVALVAEVFSPEKARDALHKLLRDIGMTLPCENPRWDQAAALRLIAKHTPEHQPDREPLQAFLDRLFDRYMLLGHMGEGVALIGDRDTGQVLEL